MEKVSDIGEKYTQTKHCLQMKTVLNKYVGGFDRTTGDGLWIECYYGLLWTCILSRSNNLM